MPVLVGLSRMYRGEHNPTDILGSLLFSALWLTAATLLIQPNADGRTRRRTVIGADGRTQRSFRAGPHPTGLHPHPEHAERFARALGVTSGGTQGTGGSAGSR